MHSMKQMPYTIGFKIRIYPSQQQKKIISASAGAARFVHNRLVARDRELHELRKVRIYAKPVADRISYLESVEPTHSGLIAAYPFLDSPDVDSLAADNARRSYFRAWDRFRNVPGTGIPTFHKKGHEIGYQTNAHYHKDARLIGDGNVHLTDRHHITLPKLGRIRFAGSDRIYGLFARTCETRIGSISIHRNAAGEYYASLQIGSVHPFHRKHRKTGRAAGIDLNLENLYTDSDGNVAENIRPRAALQKKIAKAQRKLSRMAERAKKEHRKLEDSRNYQKQRVKLAKFHLAAARMRDAYLDRLSRDLVKSHDMVFAEDLKTKNLMQNHSLAGAIADASWGAFLRKLEYKAPLYGCTFLKVPAKNTTQQCSACGYILDGDEKLTLKDREWTCPLCGTFHIRDHNAAVNIKNRGLATLPHKPA